MGARTVADGHPAERVGVHLLHAVVADVGAAVVLGHLPAERAARLGDVRVTQRPLGRRRNVCRGVGPGRSELWIVFTDRGDT